MRIETTRALDFLGTEGVRFRIPVYQRVYSWTRPQCEELWSDLLRAAETGEDHFMGTVLSGMPDASVDASASCTGEGVRMVDLVDGQQRLVTLTLLVAALCDAVHDAGDAQLRAQAADLVERCAFVRAGAGALTKMELALADQPTFSALVRGAVLPEEDARSANLVDNCRFFRERVTSAADARQVLAGLRRLMLISAQLEAGDEPQSVFESLNSKGKGLTSADLIRNLLFARFGYADQERLYEKLWQPIEGMFAGGVDAPDLLMDAALHAWLEANADELDIRDRSELYGAFKRHVLAHPDEPLEELLASVNAFCARFAERLGAPENKVHVDWAKGRLTGLVSERKLFGD